MKKVFLLTLISVFCSCVIVNDTTEETFVYTFILKNETGIPIEITGV